MRTAKACALALAPTTAVVSPVAAAPAAELKVPIKEYDVPTPNSRPHDPALAPDGSLWYAGQMANKLGRLDPKTGAVKLLD